MKMDVSMFRLRMQIAAQHRTNVFLTRCH